MFLTLSGFYMPHMKEKCYTEVYLQNEMSQEFAASYKI